MCPTGSAVLRDVLVEHVGEVGPASDVLPGEGFGQVCGGDVGNGERMGKGVWYWGQFVGLWL